MTKPSEEINKISKNIIKRDFKSKKQISSAEYNLVLTESIIAFLDERTKERY